MELLDELDRTAAVLGLADDLKRAVLLEQCSQALPEQGVVVNQEHAHRRSPKDT